VIERSGYSARHSRVNRSTSGQSDFNQPLPNAPGETLDINSRRPIDGFQEIQVAFDGGRTSYHALQMKLEKKWAKGVHLIN
jgi:hypothetical protein